MDTLKIRCPDCQTLLKIKADVAERKPTVKCPKCGGAVPTVEEEKPPSQEKDDEPKQKRKKKKGGKGYRSREDAFLSEDASGMEVLGRRLGAMATWAIVGAVLGFALDRLAPIVGGY